MSELSIETVSKIEWSPSFDNRQIKPQLYLFSILNFLHLFQHNFVHTYFELKECEESIYTCPYGDSSARPQWQFTKTKE